MRARRPTDLTAPRSFAYVRRRTESVAFAVDNDPCAQLIAKVITMIVRFIMLSLVVAGFALAAYAIVTRTRHLEKRQLEKDLRILENESGHLAPAKLRIKAY